MTDLVKDNDLKYVNGAKDVNKRYTFFTNEFYRGKEDENVIIKILSDYIDVPYNTLIDVTYKDSSIEKESNEKIPCWFIEEFFELI